MATKTYPRLVSFDVRRNDFYKVKARLEAAKSGFEIWISDIRYDRYGFFRPGVRKASLLVNGAELADFDLSRLPMAGV